MEDILNLQSASATRIYFSLIFIITNGQTNKSREQRYVCQKQLGFSSLKCDQPAKQKKKKRKRTDTINNYCVPPTFR